jgi:chromosome segregation and condensation protein ScpB
MEIHDIEAALEGILFAAGEPVDLKRIAAVLAVIKTPLWRERAYS